MQVSIFYLEKGSVCDGRRRPRRPSIHFDNFTFHACITYRTWMHSYAHCTHRLTDTHSLIRINCVWWKWSIWHGDVCIQIRIFMFLDIFCLFSSSKTTNFKKIQHLRENFQCKPNVVEEEKVLKKYVNLLIYSFGLEFMVRNLKCHATALKYIYAYSILSI